ncbi:MAG: T9SS type A sorting domain-containing protein [Ignavibacteria bacterium]|nr:T9SS type A sorting domain-containing protein [Ignavibacteria bacterium]
MTSPVDDATIGTENVGGATGLQVVYNAAYMHNNLAIKIEKGLAWVDEVPNSGTIIPGGNQTVSVNFSAVGLSVGTYTGILKVNSNDPLTPVKNVGIRLNVGTTGVQSTGNTIPTEYDLKQNYPNPFYPVTKINFSIPKQGLVTLKIYDVLGKEVITLVNEAKEAGNYDVDFNASSLASGAYFYKIESGDFSNIKRMILLK